MVKTFRKIVVLLMVVTFVFGVMPSMTLTVSAGGLIPAYGVPAITKPTTGAWPTALQTATYCSTSGLYVTGNTGYPFHAVDGLVNYSYRWRYLSTATKGEKFATYDLSGSDTTNVSWNQYAFYAVIPTGYSILSHTHYSTGTNLSTIDQQTFTGTMTTDPKDDIVSGSVTMKKYYSEVLSTPKNVRYVKFAFEMRNASNVCDANPEIAEVYVYNNANVVENAKAALVSDDRIRNTNPSLSEVTENLTFPTSRAGATITWASINPAISSDGTVTRQAQDTTGDITATIKAGAVTDTQTFSVTVLAAAPSVTGITLNKETTSLLVGNTETLVATITPSDAGNKGIMWLSSDYNIATVNDNGVVTAVAPGSADITATTFDGGFIATCNVTVNAPIAVTGINLNKNTTTIDVGNTETLIATITPLDAANQNIMWLSNDDSIAKVDENGLVTAVSPGSTDITATTFDGGYIATCSVTVPGSGVSKTALALAITDAEALLNSKTVGLANGNVPQSAKDALQLAILAATTLNEDVNATQADVDTGVSAIGLATTTFNNSIIVVNKSILQTAISDANTLINNTSVGTLVGNVPQAAQDDYLAAITAATGVYEDINTSQAQVDEQITALATATTAFNNAKIKDTPKYSVTGTVSILTGADLTKVSVVAKQAGVTKGTASVLANGTFSISLEPGVYTFEVGRIGYLKKVFTNFAVTTDVSQVLSPNTINLIAGDVVVTDQNTIDLQDLQRILSNFGLTRVDGTFNTLYDLNDDGAINLIDLQAVLKNFGAVQ